jgi:sodium pump decarboxylase gamma subunit
LIDVVTEGLRTTVLGMGVVFLSLGALYYVLRLFARIAHRTAKVTRERDEAQRFDAELEMDPEASPEIAAVIASVLSLEGSVGGRVRVKSVQRSDRQRAAVLEEGTEA